MSALTPATNTAPSTGITWPQLQLPAPSGLSPASQSAFTQLTESMQSWYANVQGAVSNQFNAVQQQLSSQQAATAAATPAPTASAPSTSTTAAIGTPSNQITTDELTPGILSADESGRALMAAQYLTPDKLKQGAFTADTNGRQGFGGGFVNAAMIQPDALNYSVLVQGGASGYTIDFTPHLSSYGTTYTDGLQVAFRAPAACAVGCTLDAGFGPILIYRADGSALQAGDVPNAAIVCMVFNTALNNAEGGWQMFYLVPPALPARAIKTGALPAPGSTTQIAHAIGAVPNSVRVVAVLAGNAGGLLLGAEIDIGSLSGVSVQTGSLTTISTPRPLTVTVDATNVNVRLESAHLYINNNGTLVDIVSNCTLKVYAGG